MSTPAPPSLPPLASELRDQEALAEVAGSLAQVLEQIQAVVAVLEPEQYTQNPVGPVHSTIGGHVRHSLDHVRAWLVACETGELDFDHRERNTPVERDPVAAEAEIARLIVALLGATPSRSAWRTTAQATEGGRHLSMETGPLRELVFVLSHTIHHNALIGVMARVHGVKLPARFGYAPATLTHLARAHTSPSCAR